MNKSQILYLAANPSGPERFALDREAQEIRAELDRTRGAECFEFVTYWAAQAQDLHRELRRLKPTIVHLSGHGHKNAGESGLHGDTRRQDLVVRDLEGRAPYVPAAALKQALADADSVRLVMLDACHSGQLAEALLSHVDCVVGTGASIHDDAARNFVVSFYARLGEGESVADAYQQGRAAIRREGMRDSDRPQLKVRDGVDASRFVVTADPPARTGPTVETMLDAFTVHTPPDELRPITYFLGECVARRQTSTLARFHARARQLRRLSNPGSWHRGFADGLTAYLDGYFAEHAPAVQREKLAREVAGHELWREILYALRGDRALSQVAIGERVGERAPGVASSKPVISVALEDLRVRELVEYVPGKADRRERIHSLTMRGRELLAEPIVSSAVMSAVSDHASISSMATDSGASPAQRSPQTTDTKSPRLKRRAPLQAFQNANAGRASPRKGDRPRKRRLPSEPPPAGG